MRRFTEEQVKEFIDLYTNLEIDVIIDGGWGVDALLGRQTREHEDLDIAIDHDNMPPLKRVLEEQGFTKEDFPEVRDCNFKMVHPDGRQIDFHTYRLNDKGENIYGIAYVPEHLTGRGVIAGREVRCIDPHWMVKFHTWYEPDENDYHDVKLLCERYTIPMPNMYEKFKSVRI